MYNLAIVSLCLVLELQLTQSTSQTQSKISNDLVDRLNAEQWTDRAIALKELLALGGLDEPRGRELLMTLLARERNYLTMILKDRSEVAEGYSDPYYSTLIDAASKAFQATPSPRNFEELMQGSFNATSSLASNLTTYVSAYLPILERLVFSDSSQYVRLNAAAVVVHAIRKGDVQAPQRKRALSIVDQALNDSSSEVRVAMIFLLSRLEGDDVNVLLLARRKKLDTIMPRVDQNEFDRLTRVVEMTDPKKRIK